MMRFRLPLFVLLVCMAGAVSPAMAQDDPAAKPPPSPEDAGAKNRLDSALSVLRDHQTEAGKSCLEAMTVVHQTEDQVASLGQSDSNSNHPDNGADVARDVLQSDYETADAACRPDAVRVCQANPAQKACMSLNAGGENRPPPR